MKKIIQYTFIIITVAFLFSGCNLLDTVSINERIAFFVDDCNSSDKTDMYLNFHPDTAAWPARKADSTWNEFDVLSSPWSISNIAISGTSVTATISNDSGTSDDPITMTFQEDEDDVWYIKTFSWPLYNSGAGLIIN